MIRVIDTRRNSIERRVFNVIFNTCLLAVIARDIFAGKGRRWL